MKLLVVDVGTSGVRAAVVTPEDGVTHSHHQEVLPSSPAPGLVEFDAAVMAEAVLAVAGQAAADAGTPPLAVELVTASLTSQNLDDKLGYAYGGSRAAQDRFVETFPHARWADFDGHGYVIVDVDHERVEAAWTFVDTVLEPSDDEFTAATYQVPRGRAELVAVVDPLLARTPTA